MTARKIIIDCDPGIDDALALVYAHGHPGLALAGLTTVAGNVSLDKTTANALRIRDFLGMTGVPVVAGSQGPLLRSAIDARDVHGESGLGQVQLPDPATGPDPGHAADFIIDQVRAAPGEITLIAVGPLTNIALAVRRYPALTTEVSDFVIMGGSSGRGNVTPAAEFNIAADPEAAAIVFGAGWTVTMVGLDVTLQARADTGIRTRLATLGKLADELMLPVIAGYRAPSTAARRRRPGPGRPGRARRLRRRPCGRAGPALVHPRAGPGRDRRAVHRRDDRDRLRRPGPAVERAGRHRHRRAAVLGHRAGQLHPRRQRPSVRERCLE